MAFGVIVCGMSAAQFAYDRMIEFQRGHAMSEVQNHIERRIFSRRSAMIECTISIDPLPDAPEIERCYRQAAEALVEWLERERLPVLAVQQAAERGKDRLHRSAEQWTFALTVRPLGSYRSVCLRVMGKGKALERSFVQHRVWDAEKGVLCPLSVFLSPRKAKKYDKWEYSIENEQLILFQKGKMHKNKPKTIKLSVKR